MTDPRLCSGCEIGLVPPGKSSCGVCITGGALDRDKTLASWFLLALVSKPSRYEDMPVEFESEIVQLASIAGTSQGRPRLREGRIDVDVPPNRTRQIRVRKRAGQLA